jgi:hypothetical protein
MLRYDSLFELRGLFLRPAKNQVDPESFRELVRGLP